MASLQAFRDAIQTWSRQTQLTAGFVHQQPALDALIRATAMMREPA
jgi:hypothetical protein